jgi:hypothetical protein
VNGVKGDPILYAPSKKNVAGISLSKNQTFVYTFNQPVSVPKDSSFELEYEVHGSGSIVLHIEGDNDWELPLNAEPVTSRHPSRIRYAVPVNIAAIERFSLIVTKEEESDDAALDIKAVHIGKRWFGFLWDDEATLFAITPFVQVDNGSNGAELWTIDPEPPYRNAEAVELSTAPLFRSDGASGGEDRITVEPGSIFFEWTSPHNSENTFFVPSLLLPANPYPLRISISNQMGMIRLESAPQRAFPTPLLADPGIVLAYRQGDWRDTRYEVFRWENFPSILIFDTANYDVQDRLFRRLAFFVEKAGYRGRLLTDRELGDQHGWNAHDYRAESLAAFFEATESIRFPLLREEQELKDILLANGILRLENNKIVAGTGAIISLSQQSPDTLRRQFMAHEGFHGIFFIDQELRDFSSRRFEALSPVARKFILSFFDYQHYDITDQYLIVNEFAAHVLQQNTSKAAWYFGGTLAARLEASPWRHSVLPDKDEASATWPEIASAFQTEADAFSAYVKARWGFVAGRNWRVKVK